MQSMLNDKILSPYELRRVKIKVKMLRGCALGCASVDIHEDSHQAVIDIDNLGTVQPTAHSRQRKPG